ncbi:hypothetical protein NL108_009951 [Boleophthalmus pectinirostris]|nr:hypothetical protein NL108_009951 [Boleophthalmus pectinirostris]
MFLSGLHSLVFDWLVTQITARTQRLNLELNTQDHLLIVLMKLKLGLCDRDLGYRFRIRESSVTTICQTWIPAVAFMLKPLIAWPNVETVAKQRPAMFERKFSKCRGIIDFPEFIVTKTTDKAPENTTVRYFSSVTPAGTVSFLSSGYSEDMSKSQIAKECGFLHLLERQDEILSRKKINVKDDLASLGATLHTPEYVDGKLVPKSDLEKMVWTHAKNVIGWWKDFKLLEKVVPETYGNLLDDVLTVCAALTNVNLSVFPNSSDKKS